MGGIFGVVSNGNCVEDLFYGTDYHSHLGTMFGGLAIKNGNGFQRHIHDISGSQFRSELSDDVRDSSGHEGIGVISDTDPQPLIPHSHLGEYAIVTVGRINNLAEIAEDAFRRGIHMLDRSGGLMNPTEAVGCLIDQGRTFEEGIANAQNVIKGSCSMLVLTEQGLYASRDKLGRTPLIIGKKDGAIAVASETTSFPNLGRGFSIEHYLGPGEVVLIPTWNSFVQKKAPEKSMQVCSFLWVYYGYPSSHYEGLNVEIIREQCGAALARRDLKDGIEVDMVAGIPDSGTSHALGYAQEAGIPYRRPFVKYTPTWPRSFMPQNQEQRNTVAKMKLVPIPEIIDGKRILFCEDSIVRGTQLQDTVQRLYDAGAEEVHMRPACPPLVYSCDFLNFSRSSSVMQLAARKAMFNILGKRDFTPDELRTFSNPDSNEYRLMVEDVRKTLNLTSLRYQSLNDLVGAIGLPKEKLCAHCWDGSSYSS